MIDAAKISGALKVAELGCVDGAHHKMWVIDQVVRALTQEGYEDWVDAYESGGEYQWDTGIAP